MELHCSTTSLIILEQQVLQFIEFFEFRDRSKTPEELGWRPGFVESTVGCLSDILLGNYR